MKKRSNVAGVLLAFIVALIVVAVIFGGCAVSGYNKAINLNEAVNSGWAQVENVLQRRYDLIPNLVEVAKTYMAHERDTLEAVIRARSAAIAGLGAAKANPGDAGAMAQLAGAEGGLGAALGRLMMVSESYPDLKANQNMAQLTEELTSTENKVAFARQAYNDQVMNYNNRREMFPSSIIAGMFQFQQAALLEIGADEAHKREAPKVKFS